MSGSDSVVKAERPFRAVGAPRELVCSPHWVLNQALAQERKRRTISYERKQIQEVGRLE